jgi:hypothetical protein
VFRSQVPASWHTSGAVQTIGVDRHPTSGAHSAVSQGPLGKHFTAAELQVWVASSHQFSTQALLAGQSAWLRQHPSIDGPGWQLPASHLLGAVQASPPAPHSRPSCAGEYMQPWTGSQGAASRQKLGDLQSTSVDVQVHRPVAGSRTPVSLEHLLAVLQNRPQ